MEIDGYTRTCGVIGCPVEHTMSPAIHNTLAENLGENLVYVPFRVPAGQAAKLNPHVPAADHAEVLHIIRAKREGLDPGAARKQDLPRQLLTAVLHRAAANRPGNPALTGDEHMRTRPSGH